MLDVVEGLISPLQRVLSSGNFLPLSLEVGKRIMVIVRDKDSA
jgi:hypothetical protein